MAGDTLNYVELLKHSMRPVTGLPTVVASRKSEGNGNGNGNDSDNVVGTEQSPQTRLLHVFSMFFFFLSIQV